MRRYAATLIACASLSAFGANQVSAAEDFYKGKNLTIIASGAGFVYEGYARVIGKYLPKYIPGNPNIVVQTMLGASGLTAANYIYNNAPKDGTVVTITHGHIPTLPLINPDGARFDPTMFSWIGNSSKETFVGYVWHTAPAQSMEEAKTKEIKMGGQAAGSMSIDMAILAKEMFDLKFKIITGYSGSNETRLAVERGELDGHFGTAWTNLKSSNPEWLRDKKITIISQFGFKRHKDLPDVPLFVDLAKTEEDRQILELFLARQETAKPFYGPPGIPADRLAMLRNAFDKVMVDPEYLEEMDKLKYEISEPMNWKETADLIAKLQKTPKSVVDRMSAIFDKFRDGKL